MPVTAPVTSTSSAIIDSPLGCLRIEVGREFDALASVRVVEFIDRHAEASEHSPTDTSCHGVLTNALAQLDEYFTGTRTEFDLPLAPIGTHFQQQVWRALCDIPIGTTISYGELARRVSGPSYARAVGAANGANPIAIVVPCHRVIDSQGKLHGYAGGLERKRWLLDHERSMCGSTLFASLHPSLHSFDKSCWELPQNNVRTLDTNNLDV